MRKIGTLNPVANAAAYAVAGAEMDAMIQKAAMVLPIKQATRELGERLAADLDAALAEAITRHMGALPEDAESLRGRLTIHPDRAEADDEARPHERGETYALDGAPILWAGPVKLERDGDNMRASRPLRQL